MPAMPFRSVLLAFALLFSGLTFAQEYQADWARYAAPVGDSTGTVQVDMGLKPFAPVARLPYHLTLALKHKTSVPTPEEVEQLQKLQTRLVQILTESGSAAYAGATIGAGANTLHFYAQAPRVDTTVLATAFIFYPQYADYRLAAEQDTAWAFYKTLLYPNPREYQKIQNTRLVEALVRNGDYLMKDRPVDHFISFPTQKDAERFFKKVKKEQYSQISLTQDTAQPALALPWQLRISRIDGVAPAVIDSYTLHLFDLAPQFKGRYDGWQTVVRK